MERGDRATDMEETIGSGGSKFTRPDLGPWLGLLICMLFFGTLLNVTARIKFSKVSPLLEQALVDHAEWHLAKAYMAAIAILLVIAAGCGIYALVRGTSRSAVVVVVAALWIAGPLARILDVILSSAVLGADTALELLTEMSGTLVMSGLLATGWTFYLLASKHVADRYPRHAR